MTQSPIHSTLWRDPSKAKQLNPVRSTPYAAGPGNWHFCHHPEIGTFQGRLYAMWSNSPEGEDECGQRILCADSEDGVHWSAPRVLADGEPGEKFPAALTAAGWLDRGDSLLAYYAAYEYDSEGPRLDGRGVPRFGTDIVRTRLYCRETGDGVTFSAPVNLGVPLCPNIGPTKTRSGRLIITGNWAHAWADDPAGIGPWAFTGFCQDKALLPEPVRDDPDYFWRVSKAMGYPGGLCEGAFYQTDDGALHMLHRSHTDWLYESQSLDDGATWSAPVKTGFSDCHTKFHFGRLPDGRFYYLGSPIPGSKRNPLVLSLSLDGVAFDDHYIVAGDPVERKYPGFAKGGVYGYPHSVVQNGHLFVICSVYKEDIAVFKIDLDAL